MPKFNKPDTTERTYDTRPPIPEEFLVKIYKRWRMKHESKYIPKDYLEAAKWWMAHQEPAHPAETPMVSYDSKGNQHWTTPYIVRVAATFRTFLSMTEPQKAYIIEQIEGEHKIPWRGDDIKFFKLVVEQEKIMAEDPEKYKQHAIKHATEALRKIGQGGT